MAAQFNTIAQHFQETFKHARASRFFIPGTVAAVSIIALAGLRKRYLIGGPYTERVDLTNKVVVVTGASGGIGEETARALADMNAHVILACRDQAKAAGAIERIREKTKRGKLEFLQLDLADLDSIRDFVAEFAELGLPLHVLILNAGVVFAPFSKTKDGFESHFGTNHLGHFLLTNLLLNKLISAKGRIVAVSSQLYTGGKIPFEDLDFVKMPYSRRQAYSNSKLANILFINELNNKVKGTGVDVFSVSPGLVRTDAGRHFKGLEQAIWGVELFLFGKTPAQGAQTLVMAAVSPSLAGKGGAYLHNNSIQSLKKIASDPQTAAKLWETSSKLVGLNREFLARQPSQKALRQ